MAIFRKYTSDEVERKSLIMDSSQSRIFRSTVESKTVVEKSYSTYQDGYLYPGFFKEIQFLRLFSHVDQIINIIGVCYYNSSKISILLESKDGDINSLADVLTISKRIEVVKSILSDMLLAIAYLESFSINHFDIKPGNILFEKVDKKYKFTLCDFELSEQSTAEQNIDPDFTYTAGFMPPEYMHCNRKISPKGGDVWALGITCLSFVTNDKNGADTRFNDYKWWSSYRMISWEEFTKDLMSNSIDNGFDVSRYIRRNICSTYTNLFNKNTLFVIEKILSWNQNNRGSAMDNWKYLNGRGCSAIDNSSESIKIPSKSLIIPSSTTELQISIPIEIKNQSILLLAADIISRYRKKINRNSTISEDTAALYLSDLYLGNGDLVTRLECEPSFSKPPVSCIYDILFELDYAIATYKDTETIE